MGIIVVIAVVGIGWAAANRSNDNQASKTDMMIDKMAKKDGAVMKDDAKMAGDMMKKDAMTGSAGGSQMMTGDMKGDMKKEDRMAKQGSYKDYSAATVQSEQKAGNKVVLFFHATWCPFCKAADNAFKSKSSQIPAGVTVLKTDYDSNADLKQKYGVTYQHTFVQIDKNGNQVSKWNGGDIDNLKKYLK